MSEYVIICNWLTGNICIAQDRFRDDFCFDETCDVHRVNVSFLYEDKLCMGGSTDFRTHHTIDKQTCVDSLFLEKNLI